MDDVRTPREQRRALAGRLILEYAGALPPEDVLVAVARAHRAVPSRLDLSTTTRMSRCEASVRRLFTERVVHSRPAVAGGAGIPSELSS